MIAPPGAAALPSAPTASDVPVESNVPSTLEQPLSAQTWKVTLPVSFVSVSPKVAVSVGVRVFRRAAFAGPTSAGVVGARFAVLFVAATPPAVAAALPDGDAVSRTIGSLPGLV